MKICRIARTVRSILYIVHPQCIVEKTFKEHYVSNYINRLINLAKGFDGEVIIADTDKLYLYGKEIPASIQYLFDKLYSIADHRVVEPRLKGDMRLGETAMREIIDSIYLESLDQNEEIKICVVGCFGGFCVQETVSSLIGEYGEDATEEDEEHIEYPGIVVE